MGQKDKPPSFHLRAIAEVQILRQRIVFPPACFFYGASAKNPGSAVKIEKIARSGNGYRFPA